jgi:hypothetical protein
MAMPHPGMFMIPFGCVVCQTQTAHGKSIEIYMDKTEIEKLHHTFKRQLSGLKTRADLILETKDDSGAVNSPLHCAVLAYDKVTLKKAPYQAFRLPTNATPDKDPVPVQSGTSDKWLVADDDCWYYLLKATHHDADHDSKKGEHRDEGKADK